MAARKKPAASASTAVATQASNAAAAADLLGDLDEMLGAAPASKSSGPATKWRLNQTDNMKALFARWIAAKIVFDYVEERKKATQGEYCTLAIEVMAERFFEAKSRPSNPEIVLTKTAEDGTVVNDHTATFMLQDKLMVRFPEVPEGVAVKAFYANILVQQTGITDEAAKRFVETELDFSPIRGIRDLNELLEGHTGEAREFIPATDVEKSAGRKLAMFLKGQPDANGKVSVDALTPEERVVMIERSDKVRVKAKFLERVAGYCTDVAQLKKIFKLVVPVTFPGYPKFAINDSPQEQAVRKVEAAANIMGVEVQRDDDGRLVFASNNV